MMSIQIYLIHIWRFIPAKI